MDINWIVGKRFSYSHTKSLDGTVLGFDEDDHLLIKYDDPLNKHDSHNVEFILKILIADSLDIAEWYNCYQIQPLEI